MRLLIALLTIAFAFPLPVMAANQGADVSVGSWIDRSRDGVRQATENESGPGYPPTLERQIPGSDSWQWVEVSPALMPDGRWRWSLLPTGHYRAAVFTPQDFLLTTPNVGTNDAIDSDFVSDGAYLGFFIFDLAGTAIHADVGYLDQRGDFSYSAWVDRSRDGLHQVNETDPFHYPPAMLEYQAPGSNNWQGVSVSPILLPDGRWWWHHLPPGNYRAAAFTPPDYLLTTPNVGTNDVIDSDFVSDGAVLGFFTFAIAGAPVHADAGYLDQSSDFSYGAWVDRSRDGLHQVNETDPFTVFPPVLEHQPLGSTTWQGAAVQPILLPDGRWWWQRLPPGNYRAAAWTPPDYLLTAPNVGTNDVIDSDFVSDGAVMGLFTFAIAGAPVHADAGYLDQSADFSYGAWVDRSRDGLHQVNETDPFDVFPPMLEYQAPGSTTWYGVSVSPVPLPDGRWWWMRLPPGNYRAAVFTPPAYLLTEPNVGTNDAIDNDFVSDGAVMGLFTFAIAGAPVHADAGYLDQRGDFSYGAWVDRSRDGLHQANETDPFDVFPPNLEWMAPGSTTWQWVNVSPVPLPDGRWWWMGLPPGNYRAAVFTPPDYLLTAPDVGANDFIDSDFVSDGAVMGVFTFAIAGAPVHADAGYLDQRGDFSYGAWVDRSRDGLHQVNETDPFDVFPPNLEWMAPGSTTWQWVNVSPVLLPDGRWWWIGLPPGNYRAAVFTPPDYLLTAANVGTNDAIDNDFVSDGAVIGHFIFAIAGAPVHADAGYLDQRGDFSYGAWIDRSRDGLRQVNETEPFNVPPPFLEYQAPGSTTWQGVSPSWVQLPDGRWWWMRLSPGNYRATVVTPPDYLLTPPDVGTNDAIDSDFVSDGAVMGVFTFAIAGAPVHADAGFTPPAPPYTAGLHAEFFDFWSSLSVIPDLSRRIPQVVRSDAQIAYASTSGAWSGLPSSMTDTFASRHSGFLKIDVAGAYTLFLSSDDGSRLYLDETLRINNDGLHGMVERSVTLHLSVGYHPMRVEFFENGGGAGLLFKWSGPGIAKALVPASALWHQPTAVARLPAPWSNTDIGAVGLGGTAAADSDGDTFIVNGAGSDIWNNADAFHFVHRSLSMNGSLIARVTALDNTNVWAKAGVMVRTSTAANSAHAMMVLTPGNGASFQYRTTTGGSSASVTSAGKAVPYWVKVSRNGTSVSGWISSDGITWSQVGATITVPLGATPQIGLAVTAHDNTRITTAVFEQVVFVPAAGG